MKLSPIGAAFIKSFENCKLIAYLDGGGVWTIGWGHTGPDVLEGVVWSQKRADSVFYDDAAIFVNAINNLVTAPLSQNQFDALVSLVYNIGIHAFANSTLLKRLNLKQYIAAANQFLIWNKIKDIVSEGLSKRRALEKAHFEKKEIPA